MNKFETLRKIQTILEHGGKCHKCGKDSRKLTLYNTSLWKDIGHTVESAIKALGLGTNIDDINGVCFECTLKGRMKQTMQECMADLNNEFNRQMFDQCLLKDLE